MSTFSIAECRKGFDLIYGNASRLNGDARSALDHNQYLSAALIGAYAFDEFGKALVLTKCMIDATVANKSEVTREELDDMGFRNHGKRLKKVSQLLIPVQTGQPPGLGFTEDAIKKWHNQAWELRNAVAYVDAKEGSFVSPDSIARERCEQLLEELSAFKSFMDDYVKPYLEKQFSLPGDNTGQED